MAIQRQIGVSTFTRPGPIRSSGRPEIRGPQCIALRTTYLRFNPVEDHDCTNHALSRTVSFAYCIDDLYHKRGRRYSYQLVAAAAVPFSTIQVRRTRPLSLAGGGVAAQ